MFISRVVALAALLLSTVLPAVSQQVKKIWEPPFNNSIAAIVEGEIITLDELRREMAPLIPQIRQESRSDDEFDARMGQLYLEILQSLIDRVLIIKDFRDQELQIPPTIIDSELDKILIEDFNNDRARFLDHLRQQGKTMNEYRGDLQERIIVAIQRGQIRRSQSSISPEKIEDFYNKNRIQFFQDASVKLRMIILVPGRTPDGMAVEEAAQQILTRLEAGEAFEELAAEYSDGRNAERGGDVGWISRTDMRAELTDAAFDLNPGEHSPAVPIGNQMFLLYVEDKVLEGVQPLSEVREQIENILASQLAREAQQRWIERLRRDAYVKYF